MSVQLSVVLRYWVCRDTGHNWVPEGSCSDPVLQDDKVCSFCHCIDRRMLQGSVPGVGRQGVEEGHLEHHIEVWNKATEMIQELSREFVS